MQFTEEGYTKMKQKLNTVRESLKIATNHKYGDGDYSAYFTKALALLDEVIEMLDSPKLVDSIADDVREEIVRQYRDDDRKKCPNINFWEECVQPHLIALAVVNTIKG